VIPNDFGFLWLAHYDTAVAGAEGFAPAPPLPAKT
jgi:hypothetical protein